MIEWLILVLIFVDSIVGFVSGFGTSTLLLPILLLWYPIGTALILTGFVHLLNNIGKAGFFFRQTSWRFLFIFGVPAVILSIIGAQFVFIIDRAILARIIGLLLLIYVVAKVGWNRTITIKKVGYLAIGGGFYGLMEGLTGIGGALRAALLNAYDMTPGAFIATNGFIALLVDLARLATYTSNQAAYTFAWWFYGLVACVTLAGAWAGKYIVDYLPAKTIKTIVLVVITLASIKLLIAP